MKKILICLFLLVGGMATSWAQATEGQEVTQQEETLFYELKFNWKFIWINAGWAQMTIKPTVYEDKPCIRTDLESFTNKRIDFFFKMRDTLTSVTAQDLTPIYFRKGAEEGKHYTIDEVKFSYEDGKTIVNQSRTKDGNRRARVDTLAMEVYDMLSVMLKARAMDVTNLKPGEKIIFNMASGKRIEEQTLIFREKKNYKAKNDITYRCLVFSLVEYDKKGKEKEVITFYVTDDMNHLPVRLDLYLNFGSAKAFLKDIKGNKYPMTSIVEE